jgi:hypothetical protein
MGRQKSTLPAMRHHISGKSVVTIDGKNFYLGPHGELITTARYICLIQAYKDNGYRLPESLTMDDIKSIADSKFQSLFEPIQDNLPVLVKHITAAFVERMRSMYANNEKEIRRIAATSLAASMDRNDWKSSGTDGSKLA